MEQLGADFNATGSLMTRHELEEYRKKRGECVTCGRKCFKKKLFKFMPIDEPGFVLNGRCLSCNPLPDQQCTTTNGHHRRHRRPSTKHKSRDASRNSSNITSSSLSVSVSSSISSSNHRNGCTTSSALMSSSSSAANTVTVSARRTTREELERFSQSQRNLLTSTSVAPRRNTATGSMADAAAEATKSFVAPAPLNAVGTPESTSRLARGTSPVVNNRTSYPAINRSHSSSSSNRQTPRTYSGSPVTQSAATPVMTGSSSPSELAQYTSLVQGGDSSQASLAHAINRILSSVNNSADHHSLSSPPPSTSQSLPPSSASANGCVARSSSTSSSRQYGINENSAHSRPASHSGSTPKRNEGALERFLEANNSLRNITAAVPRSGHSVRSTESGPTRSNDRNGISSSASASVPISSRGQAPTPTLRRPTQAELQRAAETILAAKHFGCHEGDIPYDTAVEDTSILHNDIYRSINDTDQDPDVCNPKSASIDDGGAHETARSVDSFAGDDDGDDNDGNELHQLYAAGRRRKKPHQQQTESHDQPPAHGVLNRGGEFSFQVPISSMAVSRHAGSSRTLSSMSSIEEEMEHDERPSFAMGRVSSNRRVPSTVSAVYEEHDDELSMPSRDSQNIPNTRANGDVMVSDIPSDNGQLRLQHSHHRHNPTDDIHFHGDVGPISSDAENQYIERIRSVGPDYAEICIILKEAIASPAVVQEGLEKLSSLQLTPDDQDMLSEMGAATVIVDVMQEHLSNPDIQLWGCGAVWNMSGTLNNQIAFVDAGAVDLILAALEDFMDDIEIQEKGIAALSNIGATIDNLDILCDKGVIDHVIAAMRKHADVSSVQIKGCSAIANLASHVSPVKQKIMNNGGGDAVVISMVMHPNDVYLQEKALRALRNLCANNDDNKVELANIGAIDAVISAMQLHRDEAGVQEEGAWTLSNLAGNDQNKADIGDCYGIDAIIRAMWVHSDNVGVQEWCCRALYTLSLDVQNAESVLEVGGISAIINAMQAHANSPAVQEMGCAVLGNLAISNASKMRIVDEEALDAIVMAMVLYTDDGQVQERACMVLLHLAIPENFDAMVAANILELVRTAGTKFANKCEEPARRLLYAVEGETDMGRNGVR